MATEKPSFRKEWGYWHGWCPEHNVGYQSTDPVAAARGFRKHFQESHPSLVSEIDPVMEPCS